MCIRDRLRTLKHEQIKEDTIICKHKFYTRVSNLKPIQFTSDEIDILNKGLNYNIPYVNKDHITHEIINAEAAIKTIPSQALQNETRAIINNKLNKLLENKVTNNNSVLKINQKYVKENKILKQLKTKLNDNNALVMKADKGNTIVIIDKDEYTLKVNEFIKNNNITMVQIDPTADFVKVLNSKINQCTHPVSYTHLDVYKRQLRRRARAPALIVGFVKSCIELCDSHSNLSLIHI